MEIIIIIAAIVFAMAASLGVGGSTLAIINFFVAIADGSIDPVERHMMKSVYIVLRISMIALFVTLVFLTGLETYQQGAAAFTPLLAAKWTVLAMLYLNATLMTLRIMPSTVGPALQAGSWYTLGFLMALFPLGLTNFSYLQFVLGYAVIVVLAISVVNAIMAKLKTNKPAPAPASH